MVPCPTFGVWPMSTSAWSNGSGPNRCSPATPSATTTPTTRRSPPPADSPTWWCGPGSTDDVAAVVQLAAELGVPVTARGSGTGLSGACIPVDGGIVVSFERMNEILEIDTDNHVAVVQPGVTLDQLDGATAPHGLVYPVFPGENSASLGGNVATNAGGMRAVKYGVTRHQVLGLEAVLGTGEVIRTGGKFVKATTGYDLTQLIIGSEGTLALVTEATLRLYPAPAARGDRARTVRDARRGRPGGAPDRRAAASARCILEYIDVITMAAITAVGRRSISASPRRSKDTALAYLVVVLEDRRDDRLDDDRRTLAELLGRARRPRRLRAAVRQPARALIEAREKAFWTAKAAGADDIIDMVVPRASIPEYLAAVGELAAVDTASLDRRLRPRRRRQRAPLGVPTDAAVRARASCTTSSRPAMALGGAISGEHGIGTEKRQYFLELEDPAKLALMRRIKTAFDPHGILNPGTIFD